MFSWFADNRDIGILIFRLFIGTRLLYGVTDNIFDWDKMLEFETFLRAFHFPFPIVSAIISVYAQAVAGLLILVGYKIRWAAAIMVINFIIAVFMVHIGQSFEEMTPVLTMLIASVLFTFTGAGKYSLDKEPLAD